jgi:AsmA protein
MAKPRTSIVLKFLKITGIAIGSIILLMFLLPYLFPGFVSTRIRHWARTSIKTELNFSRARLSFFRHFPALTLTLHDVRLRGSRPFEKENLIEADEISLGVDIRSVFSEVTINKIFLTNAFINIQADTAGQANYNIYASKPASNPTNLPIQAAPLSRSRKYSSRRANWSTTTVPCRS